MPVQVTIPIRIRVDALALAGRQTELEGALAAALGRALANSRVAVLEPRGGYVGVRAHPPEFSWTGDGLSAVPSAAREELMERINRILKGAIEATSIYDLARSAAKVDEPLSMDQIEEPVDRDRYAAVLSRYVLPSYDRQGDKTPVTVLTFKDEILHVSDITETFFLSLSEEEVGDALLRELAVLNRTLPQSGYLGAIYKRREDNNVGIVIWQFPAGAPVAEIRLMNLVQPDIETRRDGPPRVVLVPVELSARSTFRLQRVRPGQTDQQREETLRAHWGPKIEQAIATNAELIPATMSVAERKQALEETITHTVSNIQSTIGSQTASFFELASGDHTYLINTNVTLPADLEAELIPLIDLRSAPQPKPGTAEEGTGSGAAGPGSGKTGQSASDGRGGERERGGFVETGEGEATDRFFPAFGEGGVTLECESFVGEPSNSELGADGEQLRAQIDEIAYKLQMLPCEFAGQFCLNAATVLGSRAFVIGKHAVDETGLTRQVAVTTGNLGSLQFIPTASPAIQLLRHLAGVIPLISELSRNLYDIYRKPEHRSKIRGFRQNEPVGWHLDLLKELSPLIEQAVGYLFAMTCRVLMLQLLRSSRTGIQNRLYSFAIYAPMFEQLVLTQLADINDLLQLRERLQAYERFIQVRKTLETTTIAVPGDLASVSAGWLEATRLMTEALSAPPNPAAPASTVGWPGQIVQQGGINRIRDAHGTLWSLNALEAAIATRRGTAEDIDPIIKQITDIPDIVQRFRADRTAIRRELYRLLNEMLTNNQQVTDRVTDSWEYAFKASRIQEHLPSATIPRTSFALQGIHLQAHEQIAEFFLGDSYYASGINALFNARLGAESLTAFFEFTGLILISVLCPPLGVVVGIGLAAHQYDQALEREQLFGALIDPELVITRAEVEAELFAAKLGLALAFIPEVGPILRVGRYGVRAVSRAGLAGGSRIIGRYIARRITRETVEALSRNLALAFAQEVVTNVVMDRVIGAVIEPIIREVEREATITGSVGGSQGAESVRRMLAAEQQASARRSSSSKE